MDRQARLRRSRLYFICGERPGGRPLAEVLPAALAGGVDVFQLRIKSDDDEAVLRDGRASRAKPVTQAGALFVLNDRPDLAQRAGADGVHVGQDDLSVAAARSVIGPDRLIGVSTHAPDQLAAAAEAGADYAGVGPVRETPTKPGRPAVGLEYVRRSRDALADPVLCDRRDRRRARRRGRRGRRAPDRRRARDRRGAGSRGGGPGAADRAGDRHSLMPQGVDRWHGRSGDRPRGAGARRAAPPRSRAAGARRAPRAVTVAAVITALMCVGNLAAYAAGAEIGGERPEATAIVGFCGLMAIATWGLWRARYWAVLAFQALLTAIVIVFFLFLMRASNLRGARRLPRDHHRGGHPVLEAGEGDGTDPDARTELALTPRFAGRQEAIWSGTCPTPLTTASSSAPAPVAT